MRNHKRAWTTAGWIISAIVVEVWLFWINDMTRSITFVSQSIGHVWILLLGIGSYLVAGLFLDMIGDYVKGSEEHNDEIGAIVINCGILGSFVGCKILFGEMSKNVPGIDLILNSSIVALSIVICCAFIFKQIEFFRWSER